MAAVLGARERRHAAASRYGLLAFQAIGYSVLPWVDGVPLLRPLAWVAITVLCRLFIDQRVRLTHDMWLASEAQRRAANAKMRREVEARERAELELREAQKLRQDVKYLHGGVVWRPGRM